MRNRGKTVLLVLGILFSLAMIAGVFYLVRQQEAPTPTPRPTPVATPAPAEVFEVGLDNACTISFVVPEPGNPYLVCKNKLAYDDAPDYVVDNDPISEVSPGETFIYRLGFKNMGEGDSTGGTIVDELPDELEFVDSDAGCEYSSITNKITCNIETVVSGGQSQKFVRVLVREDISSETIENIFTMTSDEGDVSECSNLLTVNLPDPSETPPASSSPTPPASNASNPPGSPASNPPGSPVSNPPSSPGGSSVQASVNPSELPTAGIMELTTGTVGVGIILLLLGLVGLLII